MFKLSSALTRFLKFPLIFEVKAVHLLCIIVVPVASAQEAPPVVINLQTQQPVELIRAYWNANVDIANKTIVCDHFQYGSKSAVYERLGGFGQPTVGLFLSDGFDYIHTPLGRDAEGTVISSLVNSGIRDQRNSFWNVRDGIYTGIAPFNSHEYIELVNYDATTRLFNVTANNNAFSVWHSLDLVSPSTYSVCYDIDGTALIPTGSASIGNTNLIDLVEVDFTFQFPQPLSSDVDVPVIIRRDTGEQVEFVRGEWRYNEKFAGNSMVCEIRDWGGQVYWRVPDSGFTKVFYPFVGGTAVTTSTRQDDSSFPRTRDELVEDFQPVFTSTQYMELVGSGFNLWSSGVDFSYTSCTSRPPHLVLSLQPDNCDYTDAASYDGWGFDSLRMTSCPPEADYVSADEMSDVVISVEDTETIEGSDSVQTDASPAGDSSGSSDAVDTAPVNEDIAVEAEAEPSDAENDSTNTDLDISNESTSQSGGGTIWLPLLILVLTLKRRSL